MSLFAVGTVCPASGSGSGHEPHSKERPLITSRGEDNVDVYICDLCGSLYAVAADTLGVPPGISMPLYVLPDATKAAIENEKRASHSPKAKMKNPIHTYLVNRSIDAMPTAMKLQGQELAGDVIAEAMASTVSRGLLILALANGCVLAALAWIMLR